ncbi:hypothetical protein OUZ56_008991 [Daphnia magna]|uniref:DUF4806 domain-containing protein n=1 Tax=Daphnia magna TaxID=35525 RepID=A0ABR0AEZ4_9CRUS|nr:hypothetical protein OUZ56_008991 [Daphnia magna]
MLWRNLCQPAITPPDNPTLLLEPLNEIEEMEKMEEQLLDQDYYYQLVRINHNLEGASVRDALKRACYSIFSIKVMANVNWEGKPKKGSQQKQLDLKELPVNLTSSK